MRGFWIYYFKSTPKDGWKATIGTCFNHTTLGICPSHLYFAINSLFSIYVFRALILLAAMTKRFYLLTKIMEHLTSSNGWRLSQLKTNHIPIDPQQLTNRWRGNHLLAVSMCDFICQLFGVVSSEHGHVLASECFYYMHCSHLRLRI